MWRKRAKHLERARHHAAFGNAAAAQAHLQRAERLLFGVSGQSASERLRVRTERAQRFHQDPRASMDLESAGFDFGEMARAMLDDSLARNPNSEVNTFVRSNRSISDEKLAAALKGALGKWRLRPTATTNGTDMFGGDQFRVFADGSTGVESEREVRLSVDFGPRGPELSIYVSGTKHERDLDEPGLPSPKRYDQNRDAMES